MDRKIITSIQGLILTLSIIECTPANAIVPSSLQTVDDSVYGPGSLTRDVLTGLDWLDWSLTTNRAVSDVASELGPDGEFAGFRYASKEEVITLYEHAGFAALDQFSFGTSEDFRSAVNFVDLFGLTREFHNDTVDIFQSRAFLGPDSLSFPEPLQLPDFSVEVLVWYRYDQRRGETGFAGANGGLTEPVGIGDGPSANTGHALVRRVPEPNGTYLILFLAVFGFLAPHRFDAYDRRWLRQT